MNLGRMRWVLLAACLAGTVSLAINVDRGHKFAWSSQTGWQNCRPDLGGVTVTRNGDEGYLAGFLWTENTGWVKLGSGTGPYGNTSPTNWGVNLDASGHLSGYAWSSLCGWINFHSADGQVTIDNETGRFSGFAWSENIGWIHFNWTAPVNNRFAWSSHTGWQNYNPTHGGVTVVTNGANGYLAGFAWTENFGWVKLGSGAGPYANTGPADWGVNMDASGNLSGYAWGSQCGWINFHSSHGQVRIAEGTGLFDGFAWAENAGWIRFNWTAPVGNRCAWSSQTGWLNYSPSHGGVSVVTNGENRYVTGFVWGENVGWIKVGTGAGPYANTSAADWGVNVDVNSNLSGYGWSSHAGWINFQPSHGHVVLNAATGLLDGFAWAENLGWIRFTKTDPEYDVMLYLHEASGSTFTFR